MGTPQQAKSRKTATNKRWGILAMLFIITTLNYADRATISIASPEIKRVFEMSSVQMGFVFSAFAWSYVLCQLPGGWLLDRFGSKVTYFFSIFLWSVFTMMQGAVGFLAGGTAVIALFAMRLLVGAAESPSFPGNGRITSAWFPSAERGTASALFNAAQYFATVLFAPIMGYLVHTYGWESVFYVMGGLGVVMSFIWLKVIYGPKNHPTISKDELDYIEAGGGLVDLDGAKAAEPKVHTLACVKELLSNRMLLGVYFGQYFIVTLTFFFLTWFPVYLVQERHMTILKAGFVASLPAIAGFLGGVLGGVISDAMIKKGYSLTFSRKAPIVCGMILSTTMIACNYIETDMLIVAIMALSFFGKGVGALGWAVVSDTSPKEAGGLSGSLFNTFGNVAGITTPIIIGYILEATGKFAGALVFVGCSAVGAVFCYVFVVGEIKRVVLKKSLIDQPLAPGLAPAAAN